MEENMEGARRTRVVSQAMSSKESLSPYYEHLAIKPWDYAEANGLGFTIGCIIKYLSRYRSPERPPGERMRDLLKARACADALIEREKAQQELLEE